MATLPRTAWPESTVTMMLEGYEFISRRCRQYHSDLFETRLLMEKTICMRGREAATLFYDTSRFQRHGAMPSAVMKTLLGEGGVQGLDGEAHHHRKQMFMSLMTRESIQALSQLTTKYWHTEATRWESLEEVVLFDAVNEILCRASCEWAGIPVSGRDVPRLTQNLVAMIEAPATPGLRHWQGRKARQDEEAWLTRLVEEIRSGQCPIPDNSAAQVMTWHRDLSGDLLTPPIVAVELLNIIRPIVAIGRFIVFTALALHQHPQYRLALMGDNDEPLTRFVQEVRRFYPFFPAVAARVKQDFTWHGHHFPKGRRVLLDLYGTDHDPNLWEESETFEPDRFRTREPGDYDLIPHGGGQYEENHRCAGEWITIELMRVALRALVRDLEYEVPPQDLSYSLSHIPALPKSGFVMRNIRLKNNSAQVA